jgi:hypothetical protein
MASDVSTSRGVAFDINLIVSTSYKLAGLVEVNQGEGSPEWTAKATLGRTLLDMILDGLQAEGVAARTVIFRNVTLVAGTFEYTMQSDILDVVGDAMYIDPAQVAIDPTKAQGETLVKQINRDEWQRLSNKGAEARPNMYFPLRTNDFVVRLWPVPGASEAGGQIRFQMQQYTADAFDGTKDVDLRPFWHRYLSYELATDLSVANSLPVERISLLRKQAKELKEKARAFANQHGSNFIHIQHDTGWQRSRR